MSGWTELGKFTLATALVIGASYAVTGCINLARSHLNELTQEALAYEQAPVKRSLRESIADIARAGGFDPALIEAIIDVESSWRLDAMRFEPHLAARFRDEGLRADEVTPHATSFGLMQIVYGLHRDRCKLRSHTDLLDAETNVRCGVAVLSACRKREGSVVDALICYNGSEAYAVRVLSVLAEKMGA